MDKHGLQDWQVDQITRQIAKRWIEQIESLTVLEMLLDEWAGLDEDALEALANAVYDKLGDVEIWT